MEIEIAIEQADHAAKLEDLGATRVELCASLNEGGLTPTVGQCKSVVGQTSLPVHAMLRPRGGNFHYSALEQEQMIEDLHALAQCGVQGLVFGALNAEGGLDTEFVQKMVSLAHRYGLDTTFHRAIDASKDPVELARSLAQLGIDRILTSGGKAKAESGLKTIKAMHAEVGAEVEIAVGSGVHGAMVEPFLKAGITSYHCTARIWEAPKKDPLGFKGNWLLDEEKVRLLARNVREFRA